MKESEKTSGKKKLSTEPGRKGTTTWICLIFFASAWMFVLGIFVGRGTAPVKFDIENLQKELTALKEAVIKEGQERFKIGRDPVNTKMELGFYEALKETSPSVQNKVKPPERKTVSPEKKAKVQPAQKVEKPVLSSKQTQAAAGAGFTIQVASLKDMKAAVELSEMLKKKGYQAYTVSAKIPGKGTWHRIRIGHFRTKAEALGALNRLKNKKLKGFLVQ